MAQLLPSGQPIWSLGKADHRVVCELMFHADANVWECRYLFDGQRLYERQFPIRQVAWLAAESHRTRLLDEGWNPLDD